MPNPFHVTHRHRGRGIEIYIDRQTIYQVLGQLGCTRRLPVLDALRKLLVAELKGLQEDDTWSMEETGA